MKKIISFIVFSIPFCAYAELITLESYIQQVAQGNQNYTASVKNTEAGKLKSQEGELLTSTSFFTNLNHVNDKRVPAIPAIMGDRTIVSSGLMGFAKNTTFGLSGKLYYSLTHTKMNGVNGPFIPYTEYYEMSPVLEVKQSLWQNAFGRQTRAAMQALESKSMSDAYSSKYMSKQLISASENLYWNLSTVRELLDIQKQNLNRAEKLLEWSKRRANLNLADKVDRIQAQAMLKMRRLEIGSTMETERQL